MSLYQSIIITGGGGMLAQALIGALAGRGASVVALDRAACDVTSEHDLARVFREHKPTLLLNCAAHTKVDLCEDEQAKADAINGHAVGVMARLAREHGTCLVHYSTDFVFNGQGTRPYRVDDPVGPLSAYGRSKLLGETELQRHAPAQWLIIRTAWLYGRGGPSFPRTMVERGRGGTALRVVNDQVGSPTFTCDLADATLDLLDRSASGIWHMTNSGQTSWYDFARAILEEFGVQGDLGPTTTAEWLKLRPRQAIRPSYSVLDISPYEKLVGRPMRCWRDALSDFHRDVEQSGGFQD